MFENICKKDNTSFKKKNSEFKRKRTLNPKSKSNEADLYKKATLGASGGYLKPGSHNYDLIINILVGNKRTLSSLV